MTYTAEQLKQILTLHGQWLRGEPGGVQANLYGANLYGANLYGANLYGANLAGAKVENRLLLRAPVQIFGARYPVMETLDGTIRIGCEEHVTSENLPAMFAKHLTPESMRPLYIAAVKTIEDYARENPLLGPAMKEET